MTKKEQQKYNKTIQDVAESLVLDAYKKANDITEGVYLDILLRLRSVADEQIRHIQEIRKNKMTLEYEEIMETGDNQKFGNVLSEMFNTYKKKNADYGNSFSETIQEFGYIPAVARINDKLKRVKNMVKGNDMNITDESMRDNLLDIANYCVLTIVELDNQK